MKIYLLISCFALNTVAVAGFYSDAVEVKGHIILLTEDKIKFEYNGQKFTMPKNELGKIQINNLKIEGDFKLEDLNRYKKLEIENR